MKNLIENKNYPDLWAESSCTDQRVCEVLSEVVEETEKINAEKYLELQNTETQGE